MKEKQIESMVKTTPLSDAYYNCNFMSAILKIQSNKLPSSQPFIQNYSANQPHSTTIITQLWHEARKNKIKENKTRQK